MKLLLFLAALIIAAAQPHTRPPAAPPAHKRPATPSPKLSDAEIQSRIQARLAKSKIGQNGFKFTTSGGVTTIEGKANVIQHKGAATRIAKTAGARAVVNKIEISEAARNAAREKLDSGRRRAQVKRGEVRTLPR
jgi:osmotically-inducible protein OsmY